MSTTTSDRGEQILAEADRLARTFAERASVHDLEASFPHDNYADLAAAGIRWAGADPAWRLPAMLSNPPQEQED